MDGAALRSLRRPSLAGLTVRGRCLLAAGVAASICALVLHEVNLLRVGVFLVATPLLSYLMVTRTRYRLTCTRRLDPVRVSAGQGAQARLALQNVSRLPTGVLLAEDNVPYMLGGRPRFVLDRLLPQRSVEVDYEVRSQLRGRFRLGPLTVRLTDPFGLCELTRAFTATDVLVVTPQILTLPDVRLGGEWSGAGDSRQRSVATAGEDDIATREYRQGDDLRRVHWRSTARRGELMVRREEQPWESRAAVLLDCRRGVHLGDGPASSLEWAISAAASISLHLTRAGFGMRFLTDAADEVSSATIGAQSFDSVLLDLLALTEASSSIGLQPAISALRHSGGEQLYVAVVGPMTSDDVQALARARHGGAGIGVAVVIDTSTWTTMSPRSAAAAADVHRETCEALAAAGWRVLPVRRGSSLPDLWSAAGSGLQASAARDAALRVPPQAVPVREAAS